VEEADFELEPPRETFDEPVAHDDHPAPPEPAPAADDGGWTPATPRPAFGEVDLAADDANATDLPIPQDEPLPAESGYAWNEGAPSAPPPDTLDLSDLPHAKGFAALDDVPPAPADPLEFDPTVPAQENLEADLSSPLPAGRPAEDGLEVLSFLDEAARETRPRAGRVTRYHVRRRSGKVFGPFEPGVIVKMLEDGQLLGNEEVSLDAESWTPLSAVGTFAQAMQRLVASPAAMPTAPALSPVRAPAPPVERPKLDLDQLAQAYGGRMAVVSVVDGTAQAARRKRLLTLGAVGLAILAAVGAGASLGFTRYGPFGLRWLFPARVGSSGTEGSAFTEARKGLTDDTWPGVRRARVKLEELLARREYPEVRAVWCQSLFLEQRRWGTVEPTLLTKASSALDDLQLLSKTDPERVKAEVGQALLQKQPDAALALIRASKLDADGPLLESEALVQKGQLAAATELLDGAVKANSSARGWHALGLLHLALNKPDRADADFTAALKLAPQHLSSAVERGALALDRKDPTAALGHVEPALVDPKALAPVERARALAIRGAALLALDRAKDGAAGLEEAVKLDGSSALAKGTLARIYASLHEDLKAVPLWAEVVKLDPKSSAWAAGQVRSLLAAQKPEDALAVATKARASFPKDSTLALLAGRAQELLDRNSDAEQSYKNALELDPANVEAGLQLARLHLRQRRFAEAKVPLTALAERFPQDPRVRIGLGDLALASGDVGAAQSEYERATALAPDLAEGWVARARAAVERKSWKEARLHAEKGLSVDPGVPEGRFVHGLALWKLGELDAAATELEAARKPTTNARVEVTLGAVKFEQGKVDEAGELLAQVLKAEPGNPDANFWMARVNDKKGQYSNAVESIRAALDRAPTRPAFHYELGRILRDAGKLPESVEAWRAAVKLDPGYADAWEALGQAYLQSNRYKDAVASFESCLKADPSRARILGSLGDCHFQVGKWSQAIGSYQAALKADPSLTSLYYRLGRASSELGQYDKAIGWYQRAISAEPDNAMAYYHLGYAWKERGNKREAVAAFQKYLAKAPEAKDRKDIEDEVYFLSR
jgi:tetratricopeptide (TPR) repeat protein